MLPLKLVGLVVSVAVIVSYFHTPVPDGMNSDDQWLMRKLFALYQAGKIVSRLGALVGYDSVINITRSIRNSKVFNHDDKYKVTSTHHDFNGVGVTFHEQSKWRKGQPLRPALFYIHGGGWIYEMRELFLLLERYWADQLEFTVIAVEYPLAPENPYPLPLQACYKAIKYLHQNALEFGIDETKISIAGDSAGGNLAAAVALKLRDSGDNFLFRQILIAPALQFASFRLDSYEENDRYAVLTRKNMITFWLHYMNQSVQFVNELTANEHLSSAILKGKIWPFLQKYQQFPQDHVKIDEKVVKNWAEKLLDPYLCPMFAESLKNLPPTLILATEFDILRDEALAYGDRLKADGVETKVIRLTGFHGTYCLFEDSLVGGQMVDGVVDYLKTAVASVPAAEKP